MSDEIEKIALAISENINENISLEESKSKKVKLITEDENDENWAEVMAEVDKIGENLPKSIPGRFEQTPGRNNFRFRARELDAYEKKQSEEYAQMITRAKQVLQEAKPKRPIIINMRANKPTTSTSAPPVAMPVRDNLGVRSLEL